MAILTNSVSGMLVATKDGHVARINDAIGSSPTFADISPTFGQQANLGDAIKLVLDPRNSRHAFLYGSQGILVTNDITATPVSWQIIHAVYPGISDIDNGNGTHTMTLDFTMGPSGIDIDSTPTFFSPHAANSFDYVAGSGWRTPAYNNPAVSSTWYHRIALGRTVTQNIRVKHFKFTFDITSTFPPSNYDGYISAFKNSSLVLSQNHFSKGLNITYTSADIDVDYNIGDVIGFWCEGSLGILVGAPDMVTVMHKMEIIYYDNVPPFGISDGTLIADFQPANNRKDTYYWLSKRTVSSVDYVYFNVTFDNFVTVQSRQVAKYSNAMVYGIAQANRRLGATCKLWVTAGDPTGTDKGIYESQDNGITFTKLLGSEYNNLGSGGGVIYMPRQLPNGLSSDSDLIAILGPQSGSLSTAGIGTNQTAISNATGILSNQAIHACGYNGNLINVGVKTSSSNKLVISSDGGSSWVDKTLLSGNEIHSLNGYGNDSNYLLIGGQNTLAYSLDRGTTWTSLWSSFSSWATGWNTKIITAIPSFPPAPTHKDAGCPVCQGAIQ